MIGSAQCPVVFLGPSGSEEDVLSFLPDAVLQPPVRRGDLYRFRILKHRLFIIIDGVFANSLAISPREVIDVLEDGATVIGASSMGALRAADCAPAGAIGMGLIYRLYRRRAISSEVEVAVSYREDQPFPSLTVPLVNMRVALRRATRMGLTTAETADRVIRAAAAQSYRERTWSSAIAGAGVQLPARTRHYLAASDVKREDARLACRQVAERRVQDSAYQGAPRSNSHVFGLLGDGRERAPDPMDGSGHDSFVEGFVNWLVISGRAGTPVDNTPDRDGAELDFAGDFSSLQIDELWRNAGNSVDFEAMLMRFSIFRRGVNEGRKLGLIPDFGDGHRAELELADAYGAATWRELSLRFDSSPRYRSELERLRDELAIAKCLKRHLFAKRRATGSERQEAPLWR